MKLKDSCHYMHACMHRFTKLSFYGKSLTLKVPCKARRSLKKLSNLISWFIISFSSLEAIIEGNYVHSSLLVKCHSSYKLDKDLCNRRIKYVYIPKLKSGNSISKHRTKFGSSDFPNFQRKLELKLNFLSNTFSSQTIFQAWKLPQNPIMQQQPFIFRMPKM